MINLPKPSPLSMKGSSQEQINYLISYLKMLVPALEKTLSGIKSVQGENDAVIKDISLSNGTLKITYTNGSHKEINL